jgi:hypothetical protein
MNHLYDNNGNFVESEDSTRNLLKAIDIEIDNSRQSGIKYMLTRHGEDLGYYDASQAHEKFIKNPNEVIKIMSPKDLFGETINDYSKEQRKERWDKILSLEKQNNLDNWSWLNDDALSNETCDGCIHRNQNWCESQGLPTNYNPILKGLGMACMGVGYEDK